MATPKTRGSDASHGVRRMLDCRAEWQNRIRKRSFAGSIVLAFMVALSLILLPSGEQILAQATPTRTPTPSPTRTPTRVPPTATPFPCNTGTHEGMTYTYADLHRWNTEVISVSASTGVPANVIKAIMWVESRGMLNARSPMTSSGYYFGLMQVGATSSLPDYMKSVVWLCDNAYNQILAGATEMVNKSYAIGSQNWIQVAGAYFGYGTDVLGTTTNSYMQQFHNHATALIGTTPGATDWTPPPLPTPTVAPVVSFAIGSTITVDADILNMRNGPSLSSSITKTLPDGTSGIVKAGPTRADNFDWYQIELKDKSTGWVAGQYMKTGGNSGPATTATPTPTRTTVANGNAGGGFSIGDNFRVIEYVNFRTNPGYAGGIIRTLDEGTTGTIIGSGRVVDGLHWSNVRLSDNSSGWIASDYIARITITTATPAVTHTATQPAATSTPAVTSTPTATTPSKVDENPAGTVYRTTTRVNLRRDPTTSSPIIMTLSTGALATSLGNTAEANGHTWLRIQSGSSTGWMSLRYLTATGTTVATPTGVASATSPASPTQLATSASASHAGQVYRTTTRVNLRQSPGTSGSILATLPSGATLISLGDSTTANGYVWLRVQAGPLVGWLAMNYISATGTTASTPTGIATSTAIPTTTPTKTATPARPANGYISGDVVRVASGPLNYRTAAGTSSGIIGTLPTGSTAMILNGPTSANGLEWYQLQVTGQPNGWVAANYLSLVSASVVHGSTGDVENVSSTLELTPTPTMTPALPSGALVSSPEMTTGESIPSLTVDLEATELSGQSEAPAPTQILEETETPILAETPVPATETPTPTSTPTPMPDTDGDGDGIDDTVDRCPGVSDRGLDTDGDGIDDACDSTPAGEPTDIPVVKRSFEYYAVADASLLSYDPATPVAVDTIGSLPLGGETGGIAYITFYPDQIGYGQVETALLYLTGIAGSGPVDIAVANGVAIDEYALTLDSAPSGNWAASVWIDAGVVVPVDLTGWIGADGPVTIIVSGDGVALGSREGGSPAWLSITVLDSQ